MLLNLHVKNFALIEEAEINFEEGLNILTGETGAGKSILIDAVSAALGSRVKSDVIRSGAPFAYVELVFSVPEKDKKDKLAGMDIVPEYDCITVSRKIFPGRSVHKINGESVTSSKLKKVTEMLLDIHGQHEHQSLLKKSKHLEILDQFAGEQVNACRKRVQMAYKELMDAEKNLADFNMDEEQRLRRMDFLSYEITEIEEAHLKEGEEQELEDRYRQMSHWEKISRSLQTVSAEIENNEGGAADAVSRGLRELRQISDYAPELANMAEELAAAEDILNNLSRSIEDYLSDSSYDEQEFLQTEKRLDLIHHLESKYGNEIADIEKAYQKKQEEWDILNRYDTEKKNALQRCSLCREHYTEEAVKLREARKASAPALTEQILEGLRELNFLDVSFRIQFSEKDEPGAGGMDEAEFLISTNPGEPVRPLGEVASGGELSRIMLAIKTILADKDDIPTVIFDEIDTGISGRTAQMVGYKLSRIAGYRQVLCITHLPQIAAMADHHIGISKDAAEGSTHTRIQTLNHQDSINELARLLGGVSLTQGVYQMAEEMKDLADRKKADWKKGKGSRMLRPV